MKLDFEVVTNEELSNLYYETAKTVNMELLRELTDEMVRRGLLGEA